MWTHFIHDVPWTELAATPLLRLVAYCTWPCTKLWHYSSTAHRLCLPGIHLQSFDQTNSLSTNFSINSSIVVPVRSRTSAYSSWFTNRCEHSGMEDKLTTLKTTCYFLCELTVVINQPLEMTCYFLCELTVVINQPLEMTCYFLCELTVDINLPLHVWNDMLFLVWTHSGYPSLK